MRRPDFSRYALCSSLAAAMLTGCGGSQPSIGMPGAMPQSRANAAHAERGGSWMLPAAEPNGHRIYVTTNPGYQILTYKLDGRQTQPEIGGVTNPWGLALRNRKLYAAEYCNPSRCDDGSGGILSFTLGGLPTKPAISGLSAPDGIAVDDHGKIYVTNWCSPTKCGRHGEILTFDSSGNPSSPTIPLLTRALGVAVDERGKIYVTTGDSMTTYLPTGQRTTPTIKVSGAGVAVDRNGKIYVVNQGENMVTTYTPNGKRTTPTISSGLSAPYFIAIGEYGKIYVTNAGNSTITTYDVNGRQIKPTIYVDSHPVGIAVR